MRRIGVALSIGIVGLALVLISFSTDASAQKGEKGKKLPEHWSKLGLSAEQKEKMYKVQAEYGGKIDQLKKQLKKLETDQKHDLAQILTDTQKDQLRKILADKSGLETNPPKDKTDPKKDKEK